MNYAPLHCHTTYSMGDAYGTPLQLATAMAAAGCPGGAVTEHGNAYSWVKWNKACKTAGIKPVFGVEHYIVQDRTCRETPPVKRDDARGFAFHHNRRYHITTLAMNAQGWRDQMHLLNEAHQRGSEDDGFGGFWYKPRIDWKLLAEHGDNLIVTSGCMSSFSSQRLLWDDPDTAERYLKKLAGIYGDRFYLEVMPNPFEGQDLINEFCLLMHMKHKWPLLLTNDVHYPHKGENKQRGFLLKQNGMDDYDTTGTCYVLSEKDIKRLWREMHGKSNMGYLDLALESSHEILDRCTREQVLPVAPPVEYPVPRRFKRENNPALSFMRHLCKKGWAERNVPLTKKYTNRLKRELGILADKNFISQMLLVWDIIDFCRRKDIMVGTRGSAAGSLVCYLIGITDLDPLEFDLLFERFVDITRDDPPDIDMDIQHNRRDEVKAHLRKLYGTTSVGDICTFSQYRSRSALDALANEHGVPMGEMNVIKNMIVDKDNDMVGSTNKNVSLLLATVARHPAAKKIWDKYPEIHMAADLDGMIRHTSKHAGGCVIGTDCDLTDFCFYNQDGVWGLDKKDAESLGFLKVDALGLVTMTCLAESRDAIKKLHGDDIDYVGLPLDDEDTLRGFQEGDLQGVFQFEGRTARLITYRVQPQNFAEVIDINALCRPGPMYGGATEEYIAAGHGGKAEDWPHEILDRITEGTRGTLLYQEQMLNIMRQAGGMSWEDVTFARLCISKRLGLQEMEKLRAKFTKGAKKKGMSSDDADWCWDRMVTFGTYAFNKSHAAAYSRVGYWCMYIKRHYPDVFYNSFGRHVKEHKQRRLLVEYMMRGGTMLPPDVNKSDVSFTLGEGGIRPGLADIKYIGTKCAQAIIDARPYPKPNDLLEKLPRRVVNKRVREALVNLGALQGTRSMDPDDAPSYYYSWYMPADLDELRLPSYVKAAECVDLNQLERCTTVGRVATRWNNTYEDKSHRVEGSAASKAFTQSDKRIVTYKIELEDETGEVFVTYRKHYEANADVLKEIRPGDIILVEGLWVKDYDRISGNRVEILRSKAEHKPQMYLPDELFV